MFAMSVQDLLSHADNLWKEGNRSESLSTFDQAITLARADPENTFMLEMSLVGKGVALASGNPAPSPQEIDSGIQCLEEAKLMAKFPAQKMFIDKVIRDLQSKCESSQQAACQSNNLGLSELEQGLVVRKCFPYCQTFCFSPKDRNKTRHLILFLRHPLTSRGCGGEGGPGPVGG